MKFERIKYPIPLKKFKGKSSNIFYKNKKAVLGEKTYTFVVIALKMAAKVFDLFLEVDNAPMGDLRYLREKISLRGIRLPSIH